MGDMVPIVECCVNPNVTASLGGGAHQRLASCHDTTAIVFESLYCHSRTLGCVCARVLSVFARMTVLYLIDAMIDVLLHVNLVLMEQACCQPS